MVLRVIRNPKGARSETTGPFSRSWDTHIMSGQLELTVAETALLDPAPTAPLGVGTIMAVPGLHPAPPAGHRRRGPVFAAGDVETVTRMRPAARDGFGDIDPTLRSRP